MRIYIATSWKNNIAAILIGNLLKASGHHVYIFCDPDEPAAKISLSLREREDAKKWDNYDAMKRSEVEAIFESDFSELEKCNLVVLLTPSGRSAHMEAGWAKGAGRLLLIIDTPIYGGWDAMYFMADAMFRLNDISEALKWINTCLLEKDIKKKDIKKDLNKFGNFPIER